MSLSALPAPGSTNWYPWAQGIHDEVAGAGAAFAREFAPVATARPLNTFGVIGDSTERGGDDANGHAESPTTYAAILSGQRLWKLTNGAVNGAVSADLIDQINDTIIPAGVRTCLIGIGSNDINTSVPLSTYLGNIDAAVTHLRDAGIVPALRSITPIADSGHQVTAARWNLALAYFAVEEGLAYLDVHAALIDPATGTWHTAPAMLDSDGSGLHPSTTGRHAMGQVYADVLGPLLPPAPALLTQANVDASNMVSNGLCLTDSNADGLPDGWTAAASPAGLTRSLIAASGGPGQMMRLSAVATAGPSRNHYTVLDTDGVGFGAGDVLEVSMRLNKAAQGIGATARAILYGGPDSGETHHLASSLSRDFSGVVTNRIIPKTGHSQIQVYFELGPGTGTLDAGQITVRNLTRGGVV